MSQALKDRALYAEKDRANYAEISYWLGVLTLLALNVLAVLSFISEEFPFNGFVMMVVGMNVVVFAVRAGYGLRHRAKLFSVENYRAAEKAVNAERLALYAFLVIFGADLITEWAESVFEVDDSIGEVGQSIGVLILVTPMVTYLTSGHGKFRDIVQKDKAQQAS